MNRICMVALIGLPAVGKTTFSKSLMDSETLPFNILHLCYDNHVAFNIETPNQYKKQREILLTTLELIIQTFKTSKTLPCNLPNLKSNYKNLNHSDLVIICDDNHYYHSMRYKLYQMARQFEIGYGQIYFECNEDLALECNNLRSGSARIPDEILLQMSKRLEPPNILTHSWEEKTLIMDQENLKHNNFLFKILPFILNILEVSIKPLQPTPTEKSTTLQSMAHDLDLLMRKRISHLMSCSIESNKSELAKELNDKRKEILKEFQLKLQEKKEERLDLNFYVEMLQ